MVLVRARLALGIGLVAALACTLRPPPPAPPLPSAPVGETTVTPVPPASITAEPPVPSAGATVDAGGPPSDEIVATALAGPFATLSDQCTQTRTLDDPHPCPSTMRASGRELLGGKGAILGARLFMIPVNRAGAQASECFLGVHTRLGWFAAKPGDGECCQGRCGPDETITTTTEALRWSDDGRAVVVQTMRRATVWSMKSPRRWLVQSRRVTVCGVGPSGVPSCAILPVGCTRAGKEAPLPEQRWRLHAGEKAGSTGYIVEVEGGEDIDGVTCPWSSRHPVVFP